MNCEETRAALLQGEDNRAADEHLSVCEECRSVSGSLLGARDTLAEPMFWEEPSADLEDLVVAAVLGAGSETGPQTETAAPLAEVIEISFWRKALVPMMSAAAALVLAVGAMSFVGRTAPPDWEAPMISAAGINATGVVAGWNQDNGGTRVRLQVEGLEAAPDGFLYELWFTSPEGQHVSAGTFREAGEVNLAIGVPRKEFPRVWITLEPVGEAGPPSGPLIMDTNL